VFSAQNDEGPTMTIITAGTLRSARLFFGRTNPNEMRDAASHSGVMARRGG
jgi:hypothetical protein